MLLRITLALALVLGVFAAVLQLWLDLNQQKDAVEVSAQEFLDGVVPSAESAAYNFQYEAANEVANGLFSQRAIKRVAIVNGGEVMVDEARKLAPTLPRLMRVTEADLVSISRVLREPDAGDGESEIGVIRIVVDRSIVSPSIVDRMLSYFVLALAKNMAFGLALVLLVYGSLARHLVRLVDVASQWRPDQSALTIPKPPRFLAGTEIEILGEQIQHLSGSALEVIHLKSDREKQLSRQSDELHAMVKLRTRELEEANSKLKQLAEVDALTQILNRGALDRKLADTFEEARTSGADFSVALMDIDNFKMYNDTFGHQQGDKCLKQVAGTLSDVARASSCILGRYGGEEFLVAKSGAGAREMEGIARHIHKAIKELDIPHPGAGRTHRVTISIGVSSTRDSDQSLQRLVGEADRALYDAKQNGRNGTVLFEERENPTNKARRRSDLDVAKALRDEQFEPFFQPQVDVRTGAVVGAETLARLPVGDGTHLPPDAFLKQLTDNGSLSKLDRVMVAKARDTLTRASDRGVIVPRLSFNAHPGLLRDSELVSELAGLASFEPTAFAVELLEMWSSQDLGETEHFALDRLREAGFQIEIGDFGSSKASLLSLHHIKPDGLKVAKELIGPITTSDDYMKSVVFIQKLAEAHGATVIAEGVETEEHMRRLKDMGYAIQQGYYFSPPMPEATFFDLLAKGCGDAVAFQ